MSKYQSVFQLLLQLLLQPETEVVQSDRQAVPFFLRTDRCILSCPRYFVEHMVFLATYDVAQILLEAVTHTLLCLEQIDVINFLHFGDHMVFLGQKQVVVVVSDYLSQKL